MSGLLDLYLEKLTAKMNLDEVQRAKVEKELRTHLEEAVQKRIQSGLSPETAEKEAIGAFGQPSLIARQFGIVSGTGWLIFERCALAGIWMLPILLNVFPFFKRTTPTEHFDPLTALCIGLIVLGLIIASSLWPMIEVNGSLRIRRFLRRSLSIPFEKIRRVSFQKGHFFGKRRIEVVFEEGKMILDPDSRNFRCAALAVNVLAPDAVEENVKEYITQQTTQGPQPETWLFKSLMSVYWVIPVALLMISWPELWALHKVPGAFFNAWLLVLVGTIVQGYFHKNRAKRGLCWLLIAWLVFMGALNVLLLMFGECTEVRWVLTSDAILFSIPLLIIWWPGSRLQLVALCVVLMIASWYVRIWIPPLWNGPVKLLDLENRSPNEIRLLGPGGEQVAFLNAFLGSKLFEQPAELTLLNAEVPPIHRPLDPELEWIFMDSPSSDYMVLKGFRYLDKKTVETEIQILDREGHTLESVSLSPPLHVEGYLSHHSSVCFSPDLKLLLVGEPVHGASQSHEYKLGVYDIARNTTITLDIPIDLVPVNWLDDRRFVALEYVPEATSPGVISDLSGVRVWTVDAEIGSGTIERELVLPESSYPHALKGGKFLCLDKGSYNPFHANSQVSMTLFDLVTGAETHLPDRNKAHSLREDFVWSPSSNRLAYLSGQNPERRVIVAEHGGVVATLPLASSAEIEEIEISPDGGKIFFTEEFPGKPPLTFTHYRVWDVDRNLTGTIRAKTIMADGINSILNLRTAAWSHDSRNLAFQVRENICVADIEAWAQANQPASQ